MSAFEVTVLCCRATPRTAERSILASAITAEEEERRARFYHREDADRFLVGRGTLRIAVGRVLGASPRAVALEIGPHGKPSVVGEALHTNVSHSGDVVLIALTAGAAIGVDVERIDARAIEPGMIATSFSAREGTELAALPAEAHVAGFFHTWTSREAVMKMLGVGFSLPREAIDVSVDPRRPPALASSRTPLLSGPVTLVPIAVPGGHAAMLAIAAEAGAFHITVVPDPELAALCSTPAAS